MKPFTRMRVARWRTYETPSGPLILMRTDGKKVAHASGDVLIDLEFAALHEATLQGFFKVTMGVCRIASRRDGLWAESIQWRPEALGYLEEYVYLVPAFERSSLYRARRVIGLALTNTAVPGIPPMRELVPDTVESPPGR